MSKTTWLSKQKLKRLAKRFVIQQGKRGERGRVHPSVEQISKAVNRFVIEPKTKEKCLKPTFTSTRVKLLELCLEAQTPRERWTICRDFLIERLESQVFKSLENSKLTQDNKVEPSDVVRDLFNPHSLLNQCVKVMVLFNVTDDNTNFPDDLIIEFSRGIEHSFPRHRLTRYVILLKAKTVEGEVVERFIPANKETISRFIFGMDPENKFSLSFLILIDQNSKPHVIKHDDFFEKFTKSHKSVIEKYKLNSSMNPSYWFSKLKDPVNIYSGKEKQDKFLKELTGQMITKVKWEKEGIKKIVISKVAKEYFPDIQKEIVSISHGGFPYLWKPDNCLLDEDSLGYELADLYLERFKSYERARLLLDQVTGLSIINLKTFRDLIAMWEREKATGNIIEILKRLESYYHKDRKNIKEYTKWFEYVKIKELVQQRCKIMVACEIVNPGDKPKTVHKRYERQKAEAKAQGFNIDDPAHIQEIKRKWDIPDII